MRQDIISNLKDAQEAVELIDTLYRLYITTFKKQTHVALFVRSIYRYIDREDKPGYDLYCYGVQAYYESQYESEFNWLKLQLINLNNNVEN